jgi:hypothetical protein
MHCVSCEVETVFMLRLAEMPGVARVEISKWSVPHHTILSLIALLRIFTRHRFLGTDPKENTTPLLS